MRARKLSWAHMDANWIIEGLISYLGLIVLLTFHELAMRGRRKKCGMTQRGCKAAARSIRRAY